MNVIQVAKVNAELKSIKSEIAVNVSSLPTVQEQSVLSSGSKDVEAEISVLKRQLQHVQETRNQLQKQLQETQMELDGLKQNLEEAERIELQNEVLQEQLKAAKLNAIAKERLVCHITVHLSFFFTSFLNPDEPIIVYALGLSLTFCFYSPFLSNNSCKIGRLN